MSDIHIRTSGKAGRITLQRPDALNALSYDMVLAIEDALDAWRDDAGVHLVIIDAAGDKAFCAGGDIQQLYAEGTAGNYAFGQQFWRDEYRLNAKIAAYPKPYVAFMQGFTMGGGVGISCHGSHRIVGASSQIAMPETGIGLVPDVGGSLILAQAPGRLGEYLGTTATRMGAADAIYAGFADLYIEEKHWNVAIEALEDTGVTEALTRLSSSAGTAPLSTRQAEIDSLFSGEGLSDIVNLLRNDTGEFAASALKSLSRNSPLAMASAVEIIHRLRAGQPSIEKALDLEFRYTFRAQQDGDFLEGIRAAVIDKDRAPQWRYGLDAVPPVAISRMLMPLGQEALSLVKESTQMKIGFIGLGNMGAPMAENLVRAGHSVTGFDVAGTTADGVLQARTAQEAATGRDVVITMLPNGEILRAVAADIIPVMQKGAGFVDCSTVDVDSAVAVAHLAEQAGVLPVDAPVSGGIGGAAAGTLTFMAGGSDAAFAKAAPLFDVMGQKSVHCGASGAGQAAKICNNMILGVTMIATCEAFALADKLGLDRQKMFDVVSTSSGASWSINAYCPAPGIGPQSPADNGYQPGFAADLMLKDLRLSQQAAETADADTPMGALAQALYAQFVEAEDGSGQDFSAMLPRFVARGRQSD